MRPIMPTALKNILLILLLVILPVAILVPEYAGGPVTFVAQLCFGGTIYLGHVLPRVEINWPAVATTLLAAGAFLALAHTFARRLHGELLTANQPTSAPGSSPPPPPGEGRGEALLREPESIISLNPPHTRPTWPF